jgi:RNA polymerase sigma-70 factor, ECF subfamily
MQAHAASHGEAPVPEREADWIRRVALGDEAALDSLFRAYRAPLYRYLLRLVGRPETAEELTNDVMVAVWRGAATFRGASRPSTWIFGIAHHKAMNVLRRRAPAFVEMDEAEQMPSPDEGPEGLALRASERASLARAMEVLSAEHREVIHLAFAEGFSCQEIAEVASCPVGTVKTRLFHARRKLHDQLQAQGEGR